MSTAIDMLATRTVSPGARALSLGPPSTVGPTISVGRSVAGPQNKHDECTETHIHTDKDTHAKPNQYEIMLKLKTAD